MIMPLLVTALVLASQKPNVLFIVADDLNTDLGCYGHPNVKTPNIDRLAQRGILFERAYCQFPLCSPSRTSFLTGRRPNTTRIHTNPRAVRYGGEITGTPHFREFIKDTVTLPQLFKNNGYKVARIGKLYHYGVPGQIGTPGLDDPPSWHVTVNPAGRDKAEESKVFSLVRGSYGGTLSWLASEGSNLEQTDGLVATAAEALLAQYKSGPFFLAVGFYRPHTPYVAPKHFFGLYDRAKIALPELSKNDLDRQPPAAYRSSQKVQQQMTDDLRREAIQAYWASISFMDSQVGRVLDALDRLGLSENTIVVMTSDHGYHLYDHGLWQKMSLFEKSARVPLIIVPPRCAHAGKKSKSLAELVDLYPTLADWCGLATPEYLDGVSLKPILADPTKSVKSVAVTQVRRGTFDGYSLRTDQFRYISWDDGAKGEQLFDMLADPLETTNLAGDPKYAQAISSFREQLKPYQKSESPTSLKK
jgi:arylsulfatase A-like enzyme